MKEKGKTIICQTADGKTSIDVKLENETVWLTQSQMAVLFEKDQSVIARHIKNALTEGEIDESNMQKMHNTISKYKPTTLYNLDVIISVGYRVKSKRGTWGLWLMTRFVLFSPNLNAFRQSRQAKWGPMMGSTSCWLWPKIW